MVLQNDWMYCLTMYRLGNNTKLSSIRAEELKLTLAKAASMKTFHAFWKETEVDPRFLNGIGVKSTLPKYKCFSPG